MHRIRAVAGSAVFFVVAPGTVAGLLPWLLTRWDVEEPTAPWGVFRGVGVILIVAGVGVLLHAFARFVSEGLGTPAPVAPPEQLVVGGLYRHVRNPMYLAVVTTIVGEALVLGRLVLMVYAAGVLTFFSLFVRLYEEPHLRRQFGSQYEEYTQAVPGWWQRRRAWKPAP